VKHLIAKRVPEERLEKWVDILWGLVLVTLPVTSFRYYPPVFGRTTIQPLALYPLAVLLPLALWLQWRKGQLHLPRQVTPLVAFLLFALFATLAGGFFAPIPFRSAEYWARAFRGWASLAFGLAFFLTAILMSRKQEDFTPALKWLYAGFIATILWGTVQAIAINTPLLPNSLVQKVQTSFSLRPTVKRRISGFAYEPAWLADQIVILYFPWLVAGLLGGVRQLKHKWLEPILFAAGLVLLFLAYSRSGLFSAIIVITLVFLLTGRHHIKHALDWLISPFKGGNLLGKGLRLAIVVGLVGLMAVTGIWLSRFQYFANLWQASMDEGLVNYVIENNAGSRLADNAAGFRTFELSPWSGVGIGGSELYLADQYPEWALSELPELSRLLSPDSNAIPNVKNLYLLLLAETGLPGFWLFTAFYFSILGGVIHLLRNSRKLNRYIGTAGLFIWLAVALRNFTQDSFTFPVMWVSLGMIVGYTNSMKDSTSSKPAG
jgi:O-antigen ligase